MLCIPAQLADLLFFCILKQPAYAFGNADVASAYGGARNILDF